MSSRVTEFAARRARRTLPTGIRGGVRPLQTLQSRTLATGTNPPFRRKALFEALEPRLLLSADPLSAAAQTAFMGGLDELRDWADRLDDYDLLSQPLPLLNTAISAALDLPNLLQDRLITPIGDFFGSFTGGDLPTADDLAGFLSGLPDNASDVTGELIGDEFLFGFVFDASRETTVAGIDLPDFGALGFDVDAGAVSVDLDARFSTALTLGLDLSDGSLDVDDFFVRFDTLSVGATATATLPDLEAGFGFLDLTVAGGELSLDVDADLMLGNPDADPDGKLTPTELRDTDLADLVTFSVTSDLSLELPLDADFLPFSTDGTPTLTLNSSDVYDAETTLIALENFAPVGDLQQQAEDALVQGLMAFGDTLEGINDGLLATPVPFIGGNLGDHFDLGGIVHDRLIQPLQDLLAADGPVDLAQLEALFKGLGGAGDGVELTVDPAAVTAQIIENEAENSRELTFDLAFSSLRSSEVALSFGDELANAGLSVAGDFNGDLITELFADFTFGVNLSALPSVSDAFFLRFNNDPRARAALMLDDIDVAASFGFLELDIVDGSASLDAEVSAHINDPNADGNITLGELTGTPLAELVDLTSTSALAVDLPIQAAIGDHDFNNGADPRVTLSDNDLFDSDPPDFQLEDFDGLLDFNNISGADMVSAFGQLANWLDQLSGLDALNIDIPFTDGTTLGDVIDFGTAFSGPVLELLQDPNTGSLNFSDAASLETLVPALTEVNYDPTTRELTYTLAFATDLDPITVNAGFDFDLGPLGGISTASTLGFTPSLTATTTFGILLTELGESPDGVKFRLTNATELASLNAGNGVLTEAGADLEISLRDGSTHSVDLSAAATIGDVLLALNAAAPGMLVARINSAENGLELEDLTNGLVQDFRVKGLNGSLAGLQLGIFGTDNDADGTIDGKPLHGDSLMNHVFLRDTQLDASLTVFADDIDALANFGIVGVGIEDGSASGTITGSISLTDPGGPGNRLTIREITENINSVLSPSFTGAVDLDLPVVLTGALDGLMIGSGGQPRLSVSLADIADPTSITFETFNFNELFDLQDLSLADVIAGLRGALGFVAGLEDRPELDFDIPLINVNLQEVVGFADNFDAFLTELEAVADGNLQGLEALIEDALGLGGGDSPLVELSLDTSVADATALRLDLVFEHGVAEHFALDIGLPDLGIPAISSIIDLNGEAMLELEAGASFALALGIDLSDPLAPVGFLYDDTGVEFTAKALANDVNFDASVGPIGVFIRDGQAGINRSGAGNNEAARFALGLSGDGSGRVFFDDIDFNSLDIELEAAAFANLPLRFPTDDPADEVIVLEMGISDFTDIAGSTTFPNIDAVGDAFSDAIGNIDLSSTLDSLIGGWQGATDLILDAMRGEVFGVELPLIGDALKDEADFLENIRDAVVDNFNDLTETGLFFVQQAFFDALGPGGIKLLQDIDGDSDIDLDDVRVRQIEDGGLVTGVEFDILMGQDLLDLDVPLGFDLGLPGFGLEVDGGVNVKLGYDIFLSLGLSLDDGFYLNTEGLDGSGMPEIVLDLLVTAPGLSATGELFFLQLDVEDDNSRFEGQFIVDIMDPDDDDGKLTIDEFGRGFGNIIDVGFEATADINLDLIASFDGQSAFPRIRADLGIDWLFNPFEDIADAVPTISFENVQLSLGDFFNDFASPVLGRIQEVLEPIQPIIEILTTPLPVISELSGGDVTMLDLARMLGGGAETAVDFIEAVIGVNDFINSIPLDADELWIDLGGFGVDGLAALGRSGSGPLTPMVGDPMRPELNARTDTVNQVGSAGGGKAGGFKNNLEGGKVDISFPLIEDPLSVFNLILGGSVDIFLLDLPPMGVDFTYSQFFPVPPFPILGAELGGRVYAIADFAFGFDSSGIQEFLISDDPLDIFEGFFISDRENADGTGADVPEITLGASIFAGAKLNLGLAEAGVRGGITAEILFDLHDNNDDGRVRPSELIENFELGPIHVFDISGTLDAFLEAFLKIDLFLFSIDETFTLAEVRLLDFAIERPTPAPGETLPALATQSGGTITLALTEDVDKFTIKKGPADGDVLVEAYGRQELYSGVNRVVGHGGGGDDSITIERDVVLSAGVEIFGGAGKDRITMLGTGNAVIRGDDGDDILIGGRGDDLILGGLGDDILEGGDGEDRLEGGLGDDILKGGRDDDELFGNEGIDTLFGGRGDDTLEGNDGDDILRGDRGSDTILGGAGMDHIEGGAGNDDIDGGAGDDIIYGDDQPAYGAEAAGADEFSLDGRDIIHGGDGDDLIYGGARNDDIYGEAGKDILYGGENNDLIYGGDDDDTIYGGGGSDELYGDLGDDLIYADVDAAGGTVEAFHLIDGGAGDDVIYGDNYADTIRGGFNVQVVPDVVSDNDLIFALGGADFIDAGQGDDTVFAGSGDDEVRGDQGNDFLYGGDGNDDIFAGLGDDFVNAGSGDDWVVGGFGNDTIRGEGGQDMIWGGLASSVVTRANFDRSSAAAITANFELPARFEEVEALYPTGYLPPLITPKVLGGANVEGDLLDGADDIDGGSGIDFLFGGDEVDRIRGGDDSDYIDAGAGDDTDVRGGGGDDVIRGGSGRDSLYGDFGIDQLYGDGGDDNLFGDGGDASGSTLGQRLFGGAGRDNLWAYALTQDFATEAAVWGDQLFGGTGGDFLFGNIRKEVLVGETGNDFISGDYLRGKRYGPNITADRSGADDLIIGGSGQDQLLGGGGNDTIWGGADTDWLEGQNGNDTLYGGSGIDIIVLDHPPLDLPQADRDAWILGDTIDGHFGNVTEGDVADDNATDILLIEGTQANDEILLSQGPGGRLKVDIASRGTIIDEREILVDWRAADGTPLVEQIRVSGLLGDDTIGFVQGENALDISDLVARSNDFVGVFDGGSGDDILIGSEGRDRLDGGRGSDVAFGFGGNDRLFGDFFDGAPGDHDILYAGGGDDDLIGGSGTNELYAWSFNPLADFIGAFDRNGDPIYLPGADTAGPTFGNGASSFGIFRAADGSFLDDDLAFILPDGTLADRALDENADGLIYLAADGTLHDDDGDADADGFLDSDGVSAPRTAIALPQREDTGLNRILGGDRDDLLFGGTGLDFMYGGDGDDTLYRPDGTEFSAADGGALGGSGDDDDAWKEYAKSTDRVWYYSGSNADDVISVDLVTEPGLLQDHHLITRLTNNNGNFTFDAQVRLDFYATDGDGEFIWDPTEVLVDVEALRSADPKSRNDLLQDELVRQETDLVSRLLPEEGDFLAIIIDALDGDDIVTIGPTVQKTVWVDAGAGDDRVEMLAGNAIRIDRTEYNGRNDTAAFAKTLGGAAVIEATAVAPAFGRPGQDVTFSIALNGGTPVQIDLDRSAGFDNLSAADLAADLNEALAAAGLGDAVQASAAEGVLRFSTIALGGGASLALTGPDLAVLGFTDGATASSSVLKGVTGFYGLSLDSPDDVDWYRFSLDAAPGEFAEIRFDSISPRDGVMVELLQADPGDAGGFTKLASSADGSLNLHALGLAPGEYFLRISDNRIPTSYDLVIDLDDGFAETRQDLSANRTALNADGSVAPFVNRQNFERRDVIIGGDGNDVLKGGFGEDWIFGGAGNDVLTGGDDHQASDLLFGQDGDDIFQVIPDQLPFLTGSDQTFIPTYNDQFVGGAGNDEVLFLGGDTDTQGRDVPDFVSLRWNRFLHRYEFTSQVWDTANQEFLTQTDGLPAVVMGGRDLPAGGEIVEDLALTITVDGDDPVEVILSAAATQDNTGVNDLVADLNLALADAGLADRVFVDQVDFRLRFIRLGTGPATALVVEDTAVPDIEGEFNAIGLARRSQAAGDETVFVQHYAFFQARQIENLTIDTRGGDDEVRADTEFKFPNTDSEWGISLGDVEQQAHLFENLVIRGGDGADRLFGGAYGDIIDGGAGADLLVGGPGDDELIGGGGNDLIFGNAGTTPDVFELVSRNGESSRNDTFDFAARLPALTANSSVEGLTFHLGDRDDWYLIDTPEAIRKFGDNFDATLLKDMIDVVEVNADGSDGQHFDYYLFAAQDLGADTALEIVPVEEFSGVPDYYLLHVVHTLPLESVADKVLDSGPNRFALTDEDGQVIDNLGGLGGLSGPERLPYIADDQGSFADGALNFSNNVVQLPNKVLDQLGNLTLEFTLQTTTNLANQSVISAAGTVLDGATEIVANNMFLLIFSSNTNLQVLNYNSTTLQSTTTNLAIPAGINLVDGAAHHFALVRDQGANRLSLYIDGTLASSATPSVALDTLQVDLGGLVLGQDQDSVGGSFQASQALRGALGELRVWNTVRSTSDINFFKDKVLTGREPGLHAWYRFNEDSPERGVTQYRIDFSDPLGLINDVSPAGAGFNIRADDPLAQATTISLGDINGDGFDDFIPVVRDVLGNPLNAGDAGAGIHPASILGGSRAAIQFGSADLNDRVLGSTGPILLLPSPVLNDSVFGSRTVFGEPGDLNADGIDDIIISVSLQGSEVGSTDHFMHEGVYVLFGREVWEGAIDIVTEADLILTDFPASAPLYATSAGDIDGQGADELMVSIGGSQPQVYLFTGGVDLVRTATFFTASGNGQLAFNDDFLTLPDALPDLAETTEVDESAPILNGATDLSVEFSLRIDPDNATPQTLLSTLAADASGEAFAVRFIESALGDLDTLRVIDGAQTFDFGVGNVANGELHRFSVVRDTNAGTISIYSDGLLIDTLAAAAPLVALDIFDTRSLVGQGQTLITDDSGNPMLVFSADPLRATLEEFRLWNRVRDAAEIATDSVPDGAAGLQFRYLFDESGDFALDASGNGANAEFGPSIFRPTRTIENMLVNNGDYGLWGLGASPDGVPQIGLRFGADAGLAVTNESDEALTYTGSVSPDIEIHLDRASSASLTFNHALDATVLDNVVARVVLAGTDVGDHVLASTDPADGGLLLDTTGTAVSEVLINLNEFIGQTGLTLRFEFTGAVPDDAQVQAELATNGFQGWFVDEIALAGSEAPAPVEVFSFDAGFTNFAPSVAGVGDLNNDGFDDIAALEPEKIGAQGQGYIIYGRDGAISPIETTINGTYNSTYGYLNGAVIDEVWDNLNPDTPWRVMVLTPGFDPQLDSEYSGLVDGEYYGLPGTQYYRNSIFSAQAVVVTADETGDVSAQAPVGSDLVHGYGRVDDGSPGQFYTFSYNNSYQPSRLQVFTEAFATDGTLSEVRFFDGGTSGRYVTPVILAKDDGGTPDDDGDDSYTVTGIGASIQSSGAGQQSAAFQLLAGSNQVTAGTHVFGFFDGFTAPNGQLSDIADVTLSADHSFSGMIVRGAGTVNAGALADIVITGERPGIFTGTGADNEAQRTSYLVLTDGAPLSSTIDLTGGGDGIIEFDAVGMRPIGDINSDGLGDVAASAFEFSDALDEAGQLKHQVVHVFLGESDPTSNDTFNRSDLVVEPGRALYSGASDRVEIQSLAFAGVGMVGSELVRTLDDGDTAYSETGTWSTLPNAVGAGGSARAGSAADGAEAAS